MSGFETNTNLGSTLPSGTTPSQPSGLRAYCKRELTEFLVFVKNPRRSIRPVPSREGQWCRLGFFLALSFSFYAFFSMTIGLGLETWSSIEFKIRNIDAMFIFVSLVIAPFEELIFRAGLRSATYSLLFGPVLASMIPGTFPIVASVALTSVVLALVWWVIIVIQRRRGAYGQCFAWGRQYVGNFRWIFWIYTLAFALVHINNFRFDGGSGFFVIFAVIPQFVIGMALGYIRLRDGLGNAMALHFLNNFCAVVLSLIFS